MAMSRNEQLAYSRGYQRGVRRAGDRTRSALEIARRYRERLEINTLSPQCSDCARWQRGCETCSWGYCNGEFEYLAGEGSMWIDGQPGRIATHETFGCVNFLPNSQERMMDDLHSKVRTHLRAAVAALDALDDLCTAENGLTAQGITAENAIDELIDNFPDDIRGRCQGCATIMFSGDKGHVCHDGDPVLCADCAFTYADVKEQYDTGEHGGDAEDRAAFMRLYDAHMAGGGRPDDKLLHTL